ncbi:MAG: Oligosaccharyl transferase subunit [Deltaproteobacteria bacterium]|nr:Oligosaccharyl transferase subunit [Deltaproteobacteria bacterium]
MSYIKRKEIVAVIFCLLIGFALRFCTFDRKSLWMDEIHTFNDSRDDLRGQFNYYKENPTYLHPPLFFILTHQLHPFSKPERDLRIIPLIFGTLSIPMIYLLARQFSPLIAFPCALSLAFMTYHISLSQDGRSYSLLMFLGMTGLYFFIKHLKTSNLGYLLLMAVVFSVLFYTSYSSVPFIVLSQILWFYRPNEEAKKPTLSSFLILNGLVLLFCLPWIIFLAANYKGQTAMDPFHVESTGSFGYIFYGVLHDWVPHAPLMIVSVTLLILSPIFSKLRKNSLILLAVFLFPIGGLYLFCKSLNFTHFVTSRYFINFLPLFFITVYLTLETIELKFERLKRFLRLRFLFVTLFIASNLIILPLYYRSEKQDFNSLVTYLKAHVRDRDKIFVGATAYMPPVLHYFGSYPEHRHHIMRLWKDSEKIIRGEKSFAYQNKRLTIIYSKSCCSEYVLDGNRLWIVVDRWTARQIRESSPSVLKGYFDGSFLNFTRFPYDASIYLFLWDPKSPGEKGIDMPID